MADETLRQRTTLEEMRDLFGDLLADIHCVGKDVYIIYPDCKLVDRLQAGVRLDRFHAVDVENV